MLKFEKTKEHYIVTQEVLGFTDTKRTTTYWDLDLMHYKHEDDPIYKTNQKDRDYFTKWHLPKFSN